MQNRIFITGIGTDVGKTIASAIVTEALQADYWKPIQAGDLTNSDTHQIKLLISNTKSKLHPSCYALQNPMSPHAAADIDGVSIQANQINTPFTNNTLVVEGAGGVLVPINTTQTILDLMLPTDKIIVVSRNYLGSINHTLLTIAALKANQLNHIGVLFNGKETPTSQSIIAQKTNATILGRIDFLDTVNKQSIAQQAKKLKENLSGFLYSA